MKFVNMFSKVNYKSARNLEIRKVTFHEEFSSSNPKQECYIFLLNPQTWRIWFGIILKIR